MHVGINTPFVSTQTTRPQNFLQRNFELLEELGVSSIRVPFFWAVLDEKGVGSLDAVYADRLNRILDLCPPSISVLGYLLNPSLQVAESYFHNPDEMPDRVSAFFTEVGRRFKSVTAWEVWNEPNASDFYLSVLDGGIARPWTAREFVRDVLIPGARALRAVLPGTPLCVAGVAEDGLVGHLDRLPALSNRLSSSESYDKYRLLGAHGHFYFIPDFLSQLVAALETEYVAVKQLFQAVAFHPYPYFRIHDREDKDLIRATRKHIADFVGVLQASRFSSFEIWATEYGARSLDVSGQHFDDVTQQAAFLRSSTHILQQYPSIKRAYWYKFLDLDYDMVREKTFGVVDFAGTPRPAFFELKREAFVARQETVARLIDKMAYATTRGPTGFDPIVWKTAADTMFGYSTGVANKDGTPGTVIVPGREAGNHYMATVLSALRNVPSADVTADFSCQVKGHLKAEVVLNLDGADNLSLWVEFGPAPRAGATFRGETQSRHIDPGLATHVVNQSRLSLHWRVSGATIWLRIEAGPVSAITSFTSSSIVNATSITPGFAVTQISSGEAYLMLLGFKIDVDAKRLEPPQDLPVTTLADGPYWFISLPDVSQIGQDAWVLRALNFKSKGFFIEIGGHDGIGNSNSLILERHFNWSGAIIEANPRWHREICRKRKAVALNAAAYSEDGIQLEFVDAGAIGGLISHLQDDIHAEKRDTFIAQGAIIKVTGHRGDVLFQRAAAPELIDYLSVDTEGSELEVLKSIDFSYWNVALMTVEHSGNEGKRAEILEYLTPFGFERTRVWFEDWFVHFGHLASLLGVSEDAARTHMDRVWQVEPHTRLNRLLKEAMQCRKARDHGAAFEIFSEARKGFHRTSVHAKFESIVSAREAGLRDEALLAAIVAFKAHPEDPRVLKLAVMEFHGHNRPVLLGRALGKIREKAPALLKDPVIKKIIEARDI